MLARPAPSPKLLRLGVVTEEELKRPDSDYPTWMEYTSARMRGCHPIKSFKKRDLNDVFVFKGVEARMSY